MTKIRLNEAQFNALVRKMVNESVKRIMPNKEGAVDVKSMVENFLKSKNMYDPPIEWINDNTFTDRHGFDGHIYSSIEDAYNDIVSPDGDEHQNAIDSLDGAQSEEDWIDYLIHGGVDPNKARKVIMSHDWDAVIKIIIKEAGPEWFLSSYSGQVYDLDDGSLLFY